MTSGPTPPKPPFAADDPFDALTQANRAATGGANRFIDDTTQRVRGPDASVEVGEGPPNEILQLIDASLAREPERVDLWMMRFEALRSLGRKQDFADALVAGWRHPRLGRALNWPAVRQLWEELAPGEPVPEGLRLPDGTERPTSLSARTPAGRDTYRRFSDLAVQIAGAELVILGKAYAALRARPGFFEGMARALAPVLLRPTPLRLAEGLTRAYGGAARIYLKREDLRRVTAETENAAAQAYLATQLGKTAVVTGGDVEAHALALATMAPRFGLHCTVVLRPAKAADVAGLAAQLRALGAAIEVGAGMSGDDPREGALRLWKQSRGQAHLALSLGTGPAPYPAIIADFQSLLGRETELQLRAAAGPGRPRTLIAAVHSEADSIGFVLPQLGRPEVELVFADSDPGGLDDWRPGPRLRAYNGAIREHAWLRATGRITHIPIPASQAHAAQLQANSVEGVNVGLEDARALALAGLLAQRDQAARDIVVLVA